MYAQTRHEWATLLVVLCGTIVACQYDTPFEPVREPPEQRTPAVILITAGDHQAGFPDEVMNTLIVEVLDENNRWVQGAEVEFEVTAGGGKVSAERALTGPNGRAAVTWILGPSPGVNELVASVPGVPGVTFTARALGAGQRFDLEEYNGYPADSVGLWGFVVLDDGHYLARFQDSWFGTCGGYGTYDASSPHVTFTPVAPACYAFAHRTTAVLDGVMLIVEDEDPYFGPTRWVFRARPASENNSQP